MKNLIKAAAYGLTIGTLVELLVSAIVSINNNASVYVWGTPEFIAQFGGNLLAAAFVAKVVYALIGVLSLFAGRVYKSEKLSLLAATAIHFALTLAIVALAGLGLKWFPLNLAGIALFAGIFVVIYAIVWGVQYALLSRRVNDINTQLPKTAA